MKTIQKVGIAGAGTMGAALAQKFSQEGFDVVLADRETKFTEKGISAIRLSLDAGVEKKVFSQEEAKKILARIRGTAQLDDLKNCDLIIEAIYENFEAKAELFKTLSRIVSPETILATNTSSYSVTELAASVTRPERFIGLHYFYHAAKNRLVEIIRGEKTSDPTFEAVRIFCNQSGKDPIISKDAYGFIVNRFFVPWLNEAARLFGEGIATPASIDAVCMDVFGIGMGPFALMNATGVPVAYHAEKTLEVFGPLYHAAPSLKQQAEKNQPWEITGDAKDIPAASRELIRDRMLGVVFFVCSQLLSEKVCTVAALNSGARIGLKWKRGPAEMMQKEGVTEVVRLVQSISQLYRCPAPSPITEDSWKAEHLALEIKGSHAIITFSQPEALNALNEEIMAQLYETFSRAESDPNVKTIYITGTGKAFVAGADIRFFINNIKSNKIENILSFTLFGQKVFEKIDRSEKKVVAVINGLALGGGLELALCADVIVALPKAAMGFPETGIGIYPGLGGTQRTAWRTGKGIAKYLIFTGKILGAAEAVKAGLVDKVIEWNEASSLFSGETDLSSLLTENKSPDEQWKKINDFFQNNPLDKILEKQYSNGQFETGTVDKWINTIRSKAPLAIKTADQLITEGKGCLSELEPLAGIFKSSDALLGLSSVGKKVTFEGK